MAGSDELAVQAGERQHRHAPERADIAIEFSDVVVRFGGVTALDGVSMRVRRGERWAVIGPNGAGKTTLFRVASGERRPTAGRIHLFGADCTRWSQQRRVRHGLGRTFQINNVFEELSVEENLQACAQSIDRQRFRFWRPVRLSDRAAELVERAMDKTGLRELRHRPASDLSHGEARQLEVALALARESRVLLLDEPAAGLSATERRLMRDLISGLPRDLTVVLIEHDMSLALGLVDRVLCLNNGRPVATGTPHDIRNNDEVQRVYLGAVGT